MAYWVLPRLWRHYEHQRGLSGLTMVTLTAQGIPGDPINIGLVGSEGESTGYHLHFEIRVGSENGDKVDPIGWLKDRGIDLTGCG